MDWSSDYAERGVFGPGGEEGKYESHESYLDRWDYSGSGGSSSSYYRQATGTSCESWNIQRGSSDGYRYSGWDQYGYVISDTGSFTEDGDVGYYTCEEDWGGHSEYHSNGNSSDREWSDGRTYVVGGGPGYTVTVPGWEIRLGGTSRSDATSDYDSWANYHESYDEPGGTWLGLYEYSTEADTSKDDHAEATALYDHAMGRNESTRDVNDILRTTHDVWEGSTLTLGYCTVTGEGVKISGELGSITRTTEVHNRGEQQDWTNVLTRGSETCTKTGSSTNNSLSTESPTVHSRSTTNDWQESRSGFLGTTTRTKHSSQVYTSDGQTGTHESEWSDTVLCPTGQLITLGSGSSTEAWSPGSNLTITGTEPTGEPTAPTYTGPDDQHFDDLVDALLAHAQDLAAQAQNSTLTTASRAALFDAAILSFNALDADENGENGGVVYQALATPPEGEGSGSVAQVSERERQLERMREHLRSLNADRERDKALLARILKEEADPKRRSEVIQALIERSKERERAIDAVAAAIDRLHAEERLETLHKLADFLGTAIDTLQRLANAQDGWSLFPLISSDVNWARLEKVMSIVRQTWKWNIGMDVCFRWVEDAARALAELPREYWDDEDYVIEMVEYDIPKWGWWSSHAVLRITFKKTGLEAYFDDGVLGDSQWLWFKPWCQGGISDPGNGPPEGYEERYKALINKAWLPHHWYGIQR